MVRFLGRQNQDGLDAKTHYDARISPTPGLATAWAGNIWDLLGSAEKIDQPQGGIGTVSDAVARHSLGKV